VRAEDSPEMERCGLACSRYVSPWVWSVVISDRLPSIFKDNDEFEFVIAHEICHILRGDPLLKVTHNILKKIYLVWAPWTVFRRFLGLKPIEASLVKVQEVEADRCACRQFTRNKKAAISAIKKLCELFAEGDLDAPSHDYIKRRFLSGYVERTPTETYRDRINGIKKLQF
jgi:Zn-dependent protease with chaperone function